MKETKTKTPTTRPYPIEFCAIAIQVDQIYRELDKRDRFALSRYLMGLAAQVNVETQGDSPTLITPKPRKKQPKRINPRS